MARFVGYELEGLAELRGWLPGEAAERVLVATALEDRTCRELASVTFQLVETEGVLFPVAQTYQNKRQTQRQQNDH